MKVAPRPAERQNGAGARRVMENVRNTDSFVDEVPNTARYDNGNLQWGH